MKEIAPKICRLCVCVIINKCYFEPFMCLDLSREREKRGKGAQREGGEGERGGRERERERREGRGGGKTMNVSGKKIKR